MNAMTSGMKTFHKLKEKAANEENKLQWPREYKIVS